MTPLFLFLVLVVAAGCSHDNERSNPLDPTRTPAVELSAAVDDSAGTANLSWTAYTGREPFAHYLVLRNVSESTRVETLAVLDEPGMLEWVDGTVAPRQAYVYRVSVVNSSGWENPSLGVATRPVELPPAEIVSAVFDAPSASARVTWRRYRGPGFARYELRRRVGSDVHVTPVDGIADTVFVNVGLLGATEYAYDVVVYTASGEQVAGAPVSGRIHALAQTWPLETKGRPATQSATRLRALEDRTLEVLIATIEDVRWQRFDADGAVLEDRELREIIRDESGEPRAVAGALRGDGGLLMSFRTQRGYTALLEYDPSGRVVSDSVALSLPDVAVASSAGSLAVSLIDIASVGGVPASIFRDVRLIEDGRTLWEEDFSWLSPQRRLMRNPETANVGDWQIGSPTDLLNFGEVDFLQSHGGGLNMSRGAEAKRWTDSSALDAVLEATVATGDWAALRLASEVNPLATLVLSTDEGIPDANLVETLAGWAELRAGTDTMRATVPIVTNVALRARLSLVDGVPSASVRFPVVPHLFPRSVDPRASLAPIGDLVAATVGDTAWVRSADGTWERLAPLGGSVSEIRAWTRDGVRRTAICLPVENRVEWGTVRTASRWHLGLNESIAPLPTDPGGVLFYPISMDVGPDGRMYVLDAGNSRVVVYDENGDYVTHFGRKGSGPGEFDFGRGNVIEGGRDLAGSIAVDNEGFIYVADVGNERMQKFAP